ncbi:hypothetical protein [Parapedobacter tibetensis]|uniref:hypothetical protein n=1 Tax=Parapedobacter tibetensis TaxID=2972951 RepID=UPI00214D7D41|nr:hypothetical protein [Parapedobacter tibetensis]
MDKSTHDGGLSNVFLFQGSYFVITGIWPVVGINSFMVATGPKQDIWLVHMVGLLAISIGLTFLISSLRQQRLPIFLAYATTLSFLVMDIIYVASGVIQRIYLLDASIQFLFLTLLTIFIIRKQQRNRK